MTISFEQFLNDFRLWMNFHQVTICQNQKALRQKTFVEDNLGRPSPTEWINNYAVCRADKYSSLWLVHSSQIDTMAPVWHVTVMIEDKTCVNSCLSVFFAPIRSQVLEEISYCVYGFYSNHLGENITEPYLSKYIRYIFFGK